MKFNYNEEFDLIEIYRKLTTPSAPRMVKACEFFEPADKDNLYKLQAIADKIIALSTQA